MGVGAGLSMYVVVVQKFTFAISSLDEFLFTVLVLTETENCDCHRIRLFSGNAVNSYYKCGVIRFTSHLGCQMMCYHGHTCMCKHTQLYRSASAAGWLTASHARHAAFHGHETDESLTILTVVYNTIQY